MNYTKWKNIGFVLVFLFALIPSFSQSLVRLSNDKTEIDLSGNNYHLFEDTTSKLKIEDLIRHPDKYIFEAPVEEYNYIKDTSIAYWLKFNIENTSSGKNKWVLEYLSVHTDHIQIFIQDSAGAFKMYEAGMKFPFYKREYKVSNLVFDIPGNLKHQTLYIRIKSHHLVGFEFKIRTQEYFTFYAVNEYYFLGVYYGILFIMALYNFLLYFNSKENTYIYYTIYVLSCMLNSFTEDGLGFQFIWNSLPEMNYTVNNYIWKIIFLITFTLYSTSFLNLRKNYSMHFKLIILSGIVFFLTEIIQLFYSFIPFKESYILPFTVTYIIAIDIYRKGYKAARFFIIGYTFVFVSLIILQLRDHNLIPHNLLTVYSFNFGILLEVVVLSFALGDRFRIMKIETERAQKNLIIQFEKNHVLQEKVNKELEEKVIARTIELNAKTKELEEANTKLQKYTEELNKFASKLDKDNWELNKKIIEETKARMISKELTLEEFSKIFPDDSSCLRYLEEVKWSKQYQCKKCGNQKFSTGIKAFTRKCSKCNYIESPTSSTIFHGVKFPIYKAFYIAYLTTNKNNKYTIDELADTLQLNRITCWKFRKKILDKEQELKKKNISNKSDQWNFLFNEIHY